MFDFSSKNLNLNRKMLLLTEKCVSWLLSCQVVMMARFPKSSLPSVSDEHEIIDSSETQVS
jgi:hypothetical protein